MSKWAWQLLGSLLLLIGLTVWLGKFPKPWMIGHRGFAGKFVENSLEGFKAAIALGVDAVELDVWKCKTGELVVFHDRDLDRMMGNAGRIDEKTFIEIRALKLSNGEQIPTLEECLRLINRKAVVNIELKGPDTAMPTAQIINEFIKNAGWSNNSFIVTSFNHIELAKFHQLMPEIPFGPIIYSLMVDGAKYAQALGANYLVTDFEHVNKELVSDLHQLGIKILIYTVNSQDDILAMKRLGVDGIISDRPDLAL